MNGSGLLDESSFNYDPDRLKDPRQPLPTDLLNTINAYANSHSELKKDDLVTIFEPGLSGYKVCVDQECTITTSDGSFSIPNNTSQTTALIRITDPNTDSPALAMRYINKWNGPVVIPAYEINGVHVPEQHLNDTNVTPIESGVYITSDKENIDGLMQGFLIRPFCLTSKISENIFNYFDIDSSILWKPNGTQMNYFGSTGKANVQLKKGTNDAHQGDDYSIPKETFIYAGSEGEVIIINSQNGINIMISHISDSFRTGHGHLDSRIIINNGNYSPSILNVQKVYRGQIIAFSGDTGDKESLWFGKRIPMLHFGLYIVMPNNPLGDPSTDPYRNITGFSFPYASEKSYWSNDNNPINPQTCH
ncbi:MAG: M23 family metallopeptidase [Anaerolineaceae bacterium]|nr:M23 family metallopeptidase [Anaerolineaceae bacterium]